MATNKTVSIKKQSLADKKILQGALLNTIITGTLIGVIPQYTGSLFSWCGPDAGLAAFYCIPGVLFVILSSSSIVIVLVAILFQRININHPNWVAFTDFLISWIVYLTLVFLIQLPIPLKGIIDITRIMLVGIPVFYFAYFIINRFTFKMWLILAGAIMLLGVISDLMNIR